MYGPENIPPKWQEVVSSNMSRLYQLILVWTQKISPEVAGLASAAGAHLQVLVSDAGRSITDSLISCALLRFRDTANPSYPRK